MKSIYFLAILYSGLTFGQVPANANLDTGLPLLKSTLDIKWPDRPIELNEYLAAQIEQETCISLKHSKCWTAKAGLHTSRELGISYGQFTIAYRADGSIRFNAMEDVKRLDRDLKNWNMETRYDPKLGMIALVVRDKSEFAKVTGAATFTDRVAFMFVSYNSGSPLRDRRLCRTVPGCDSSKWFGNVEKTSYKSRVAAKGYGQSFFEISRAYPRNIIYVRSPRYKPYFNNSQIQKEVQ